MAEQKQQATGKHPHKSAEEPFEHHEAQHGSSRKSEESSSSSHRQQSSAKREDKGQNGSDSSDLKEREYRDAQGNVHHHTRTYEEQHKNDK